MSGIGDRMQGGEGLSRNHGPASWWRRGLAGVCLFVAVATPVGAAEVLVHVDTPRVVLVPGPADYVNDFVQALGPAGIQLRVKTTSKSGVAIQVRTTGSATGFRFGDLLLRTTAPPGAGGTALATWTPLSPATLRLWSSAVPQPTFVTVAADVRVANLGFYDDGVSGGTTSYAETLVFTVVVP